MRGTVIRVVPLTVPLVVPLPPPLYLSISKGKKEKKEREGDKGDSKNRYRYEREIRGLGYLLGGGYPPPYLWLYRNALFLLSPCPLRPFCNVFNALEEDGRGTLSQVSPFTTLSSSLFGPSGRDVTLAPHGKRHLHPSPYPCLDTPGTYPNGSPSLRTGAPRSIDACSDS